MEIVRVLGVDPSLRNTGLAIVSYNTELPISDPNAFHVSGCQVLVNPKKYTDTEAILNMIYMMTEESQKPSYQAVDNAVIESPPVMFNKAWSAGTIASIAHISGAAVPIFGIEKSLLFRPNQWNGGRKKEITHAKTIAFLGDHEKWGYEKCVKSEKYLEHILDAASMALWYISSNFINE